MKLKKKLWHETVVVSVDKKTGKIFDIHFLYDNKLNRINEKERTSSKNSSR